MFDLAASSDIELAFECDVRDKLMEVRHLKAKIKQLRERMSEQFASQVSKACHVQ